MDRFIFGLVKAPVSISDSTAFNSVRLMNNKFERMWKEAVVAYLRYCSGIFLERLTEPICLAELVATL
jgi:hypothetical protein